MLISKRTMRFFTAFVLTAIIFPALAQGQATQQQECVLSAPKVCALHVIQDEEGILASPRRTSATDFFWIIPFVVATGVSLHYDARAMSALGVDQQRQNRFETVSNIGGIYAPLAASGAGYFIAGITHNDLMKETAVLSVEAMADATILNQGLKYAIDRQDPQQGDGTGRFWPHGLKTWPDGQSMPSEHAMNVWAFAHVVATQYNGPATRVLVYSLATMVFSFPIILRISRSEVSSHVP